MKRHPIQPLETDAQGTIRFKPNKIVQYLTEGRLNDLASMGFCREDWEQLAQLIGYSLSGFSSLSYVSDATYDAAATSADTELSPEAATEVAAAYERGWNEALGNLRSHISEITIAAED